jgi:hypothetical protein
MHINVSKTRTTGEDHLLQIAIAAPENIEDGTVRISPYEIS